MMKHLNQLRVDAGYSIADLARMMHVDERTACRWLSGRDNPSTDQRGQLARILCVDPETLHDDDAPTHRRGEHLRARLAVAGGRLWGSDHFQRRRARF